MLIPTAVHRVMHLHLVIISHFYKPYPMNHKLKRRIFVKALTTGSVGVSTGLIPSFSLGSEQVIVSTKPQSETSMDSSEKPVIEWNVHIFSPDVRKYPFHEKATYHPDVSKQPNDPLEAYFQRMNQEGIDRAVIVHPEPYGDDHSLLV